MIDPASAIDPRAPGVAVDRPLDRRRAARGCRGWTAAARAAPAAPTTVSRHPRLPHRQMSPCGSTCTCPISPAVPREPAVHLAADHDPGAGPVGRPHVDRVAVEPGRPVRALRERPEVRVVVDEHRAAQALRQHVTDVDLVPAAHDAADGDHAGRAVDGRRQADPDADDLVERRAHPLEQVRHEQRRAVEAGVHPVLVRAAGGSARRRPRSVTSPSATRRCRWPMWMPTARPTRWAIVTIWARRPLRVVFRVSTTPAASSSLTIVETVAAESPVAPGELDLGEPAVPVDRLDDQGAVGLTERGLRA